MTFNLQTNSTVHPYFLQTCKLTLLGHSSSSQRAFCLIFHFISRQYKIIQSRIHWWKCILTIFFSFLFQSWAHVFRISHLSRVKVFVSININHVPWAPSIKPLCVYFYSFLQSINVSLKTCWSMLTCSVDVLNNTGRGGPVHISF